MGFQVGRMTGNPLVQGFQVGSSIKMHNDELKLAKDKQKTLEEQFKEEMAYKNSLLKLEQDKYTWDTSKENPINALNLQTVDRNKVALENEKILDEAYNYVDNTFFNAPTDEDAKNLFTLSEEGAWVQNPNFNPQNYGLNLNSSDVLDRTVEFLMSKDEYKHLGPAKIRSLVSENWEAGEGSRNIYGDQSALGMQDTNKFLTSAFIDDISKSQTELTPEQKDNYIKAMGMSPEIFQMVTPGLDMAGQASDQYHMGVGGNIIPFQLDEQNFAKARTMLKGGKWEEKLVEGPNGEMTTKWEFVPNNYDFTDKDKEKTQTSDVKTLLQQGHNENTYYNLKQTGVNLKDNKEARTAYFRSIGQEYKGFDAYGLFGGVDVSPIKFDRDGTEVRLNLDTTLDMGGDNYKFDIEYDQTGAPYFNFDLKTKDASPTGMKIPTIGGIKSKKIYLDDTWARENFKSVTDYINYNMELVMPGMDNFLGGFSF